LNAFLKAIVQAWIHSFPDRASLDAQLDEAETAIGEIRSLEAIAESEWAEYWNASHEVSDRNGGTFRLPSRPWSFSSAELPAAGDPALQGEHNAELCAELGLDEAEIEQLRASGARVDNFAARMIASVQEAVAADLARLEHPADAPGSDVTARGPEESD
jgi:crotonobetainyl-CoA:carnitine CoA-transferase CaiB-like acyl-CoA transferase